MTFMRVLGLTELMDQVDRAGSEGKVTLNDGLRKIGRLFVPSKGTGPLPDATPKRSGKLARSSIFQITGGPVKQILEIRQGARTKEGAFYGWFVRERTRPHIIRPRRARMLRFEVGGRVVFARMVKHPGTKPNPYHKAVYDRLESKVKDVIDEMGVRVTAILSGESAG